MTPDDPTVRHYLKHSMVMRLATQSSTGRASLTPIWFVVSDGALVASTAASTVAARNVAADPRVAVL
ncbi:MAG: pyridoxamine 5'-phosphate oxidase family protein, partial [Ilumatobacteraceae bacterium]